VGGVRQGPTGIPFLQNVTVYQSPDKKSKSGVKRSIFTFRTVSSKQGQGRWEHPGNEPMNLMEDALEWARKEWESTISPEIVAKIVSSIEG
jgi:hypothetical protein